MASQHTEESPLISDKDERPHDEVVACAGTLFMFVGLAMVMPFSTYFAFVGWFGNVFQSRTLFTFMVLCTFLGGTSIICVQIVMETRYTTYFGPQKAYNFRICFSLIVLAVSTILVPFCSATWQVLCLGVAIGLFSRAGLSSAAQLACAVDPSLSRYILLGPPVSKAVPIVLTIVFAFASDSPKSTAVIFCAIPAIMIFVVAICFPCAALVYFRGSSQFRIAYERLLEAAERQEKDPASKGHMGSWLPGTSVIGWHYVRHVVLWFIDTVPIPFVTFAGSYDLAARLILVNFGAQIIGSLSAMFIPRLIGVLGYTHLSSPALEVVIFLQALFQVPFFAKVSGSTTFGEWTETVILVTFGVSYIMGRIAAAENSVAAVEAVDPHQNPGVSRALQLLNATTELLAVLFAWLVIELSGLSN